MRKLTLTGLAGATVLGLAGSFTAAATGAPDLATLLARADASNPEIQAARARGEASKHVPPQVEAYPDPTASVTYTNQTLTGLTLGSRDMSNLTFYWTQDVPYPGKLRLAGDVARAEIDVAIGTVEIVRVRVRAAVKSAFAELFRIDRTLLVLEESRKLLVTFREAARVRQETGQGILENVLKAETELTQVDVELAGLAQERRT